MQSLGDQSNQSGRPQAVPTGAVEVSPWARGRAKQAADLLFGAVVAVFSLPLILLLCMGSALAFRSWPIFRQKRVGLNGRIFSFVKVRSLPSDVPVDIDKYHLQDHSSSRWGQFIRGKHLDELPQAWLLVTGRMSLVGPRPEMPLLSATYDPEFVRDRTLIRPGITGPWQISPDCAGLIGESPQYDLFYLEAASPALDLWILWRTVLGVFGAQPRGLAEYPQRFKPKTK